MANPNILLQGLDKPQGMDALYRGAAQANEIAQAPMQNALLQQRVEAGQQGIDKERAAFQLQDAAIDAYQVKQLLQTDPARAKVYLANRFKKIQDRGGDPSDTAGVIQALDAGNLDFVNAELDAVIGAAQRVGLFGQDQQGMTEFQRQSLDLRRQQLEQQKRGEGLKPTANMQDYQYYKQLKASDPEGAEMFAKDVGLIPKDKTLSPTGEKTLINAQDQYFSSTTQAREYELLANDFERFASSLPAGTTATVSEFLKSVAGTQDDATELRRRLAKVRLSEALKYLPPGPATDRDVQEAFKGVPAENASPAQVQAFLRGSAKMARIDSEFQEFKANYIAENDGTKGLIPAWKKAIEDGQVSSINELRQAGTQQPQGRYSVGQIIEVGGQRYRVTGGDPNDPDVEPVQ